MSHARRWGRWIVMLMVVGLAIEGAGLASAEGSARLRESLERPRAYEEGPLESRTSATSFEWPPSTAEFLALGVLGAILLGFRASGLARHARAEAPAPSSRHTRAGVPSTSPRQAASPRSST